MDVGRRRSDRRRRDCRGCGDDDNNGDSGNSDAKKANIAFLTWSYTDYNQAEEKGIKQAVSEGGGSVKVFNANFDPSKQQSQCEDVITSGRHNGIVLSAVSNTTGQPCVAAAKAAGIPVATIEQVVGEDINDIEPQVPGVIFTNTFPQSGNIETFTELTKEACGDADPCKLIFESGTEGDSFSEDMLKNIQKALPQLEVVSKFAANYDVAEVAKQMPTILTKNPDANVYLAAADSSAIAALPAIKDAGMQDTLKVIGQGGSATGAKAIADGSMFATNGNWPTQNGASAARALIQFINGEDVDPTGVDGTKLDTPRHITKETVAEFTPEW